MPIRYIDLHRGLLIGIAFLPVVTFLTAVGCGGGGGSSTGGVSASPTPTPAVSPTPAESTTPEPSPAVSPTPVVTPTPAPTPPPVGIAVTITPPSATLSVGDSVGLTAQVTGAADPTTIWTVSESGGGTVSAGGIYTAPAVPGTYHVVAASQQDNSRTATATIVVQAGSANGTIQ